MVVPVVDDDVPERRVLVAPVDVPQAGEVHGLLPTPKQFLGDNEPSPVEVILDSLAEFDR